MKGGRQPYRRAVRDDLERLDVRPGRDRGQSFLKDPQVAARQVLAAAVGPRDVVLEIGGGLGVLTAELAARGCRLRVLEIEPQLAAHLESLDLPGVTVERADALGADLGKPDKVVANIPYSITSPLLERLIDTEARILVLMLQLEVARRLAARPGSKAWSRLGAIVQREYEVEVVEQVPPNAFHPQPKVHSAVVRMRRRKGADPSGARAFRIVVQTLFASRRRKIRNTVVAAGAALGVSAPEAVRIADALRVADSRPEELSVQQFEELTQALARRGITK